MFYISLPGYTASWGTAAEAGHDRHSERPPPGSDCPRYLVRESGTARSPRLYFEISGIRCYRLNPVSHVTGCRCISCEREFLVQRVHALDIHIGPGVPRDQFKRSITVGKRETAVRIAGAFRGFLGTAYPTEFLDRHAGGVDFVETVPAAPGHIPAPSPSDISHRTSVAWDNPGGYP